MHDKTYRASLWVCERLFYIGCGMLFAFPIKWCWNYTIHELFGIVQINWLGAWCLYILCGILLSRFGDIKVENKTKGQSTV